MAGESEWGEGWPPVMQEGDRPKQLPRDALDAALWLSSCAVRSGVCVVMSRSGPWHGCVLGKKKTTEKNFVYMPLVRMPVEVLSDCLGGKLSRLPPPLVFHTSH